MHRIGAAVMPARTTIHFLHIGKCAGTQIAHVAGQIGRLRTGTRIVKHGHETRLADLPKGAPYFFSIRDPITRFVSGFESRKRKGMPGTYRPWSNGERQAFERFEQANDLAEALFEEGETGHQATAAILSIYHTATNQVRWFAGSGSFLDDRPPVWIVRQESFEADLATFMERANLSPWIDRIEIAGDPLRRHANDYSTVSPLSPKARANVEAWYAQDCAFHRMCLAWMDDPRR